MTYCFPAFFLFEVYNATVCVLLEVFCYYPMNIKKTKRLFFVNILLIMKESTIKISTLRDPMLYSKY